MADPIFEARRQVANIFDDEIGCIQGSNIRTRGADAGRKLEIRGEGIGDDHGGDARVHLRAKIVGKRCARPTHTNVDLNLQRSLSSRHFFRNKR